MDINGILGIISFALGGVGVLISYSLIQLTFRTDYPNFGWLQLGSALAFLGFVLIGRGLEVILQNLKDDLVV